MYPIIHIEEIDSTNNLLRSQLLESYLEEGTTITANFQTAGKGQRGNGWESERGHNLLFSMVLYPATIKANEQFIISQIVSLAIADVLSKYTDDISIKWPNDIYWNEKKICGILIENDLMGETLKQSIIGVGLNINQKGFRSNAPNPISLYQITNEEHNRQYILSDIIEHIFLYYNSLKSGGMSGIREKYKELLFRKQGYYLFNDGEHDFEARINDVENGGLLVLEYRNGETKRFAFKEVKYVL